MLIVEGALVLISQACMLIHTVCIHYYVIVGLHYRGSVAL